MEIAPLQPDTLPAPPRLYARFFRRFEALVADSAVYAASFAVLLILVEMAAGSRLGGRTIGLSWIAFFLSYEPVCLAWRGATLGHAYANIRVVDLHTGGNPGFLRAFGRFWIKGLLGLFSFLFMASTRHYQALHDLLFRTIVEVRDPGRAKPEDYVSERLPESGGVMVPAWRRILVILCYSVGCLLLYALVSVTTQSDECLAENHCSEGE